MSGTTGFVCSSLNLVWLWSLNSCQWHDKTPSLSSGRAVKGKGERLRHQTNKRATAFLGSTCYCTSPCIQATQKSRSTLFTAEGSFSREGPAAGEGGRLCSGPHLLFRTRWGGTIPKPLLVVLPAARLLWSCRSQQP